MTVFPMLYFISVIVFFKDFICLLLERGEGREKERERNTNRLPLIHNPSGDQTHYPGMWELTCDLLLCGVMPNQLSCAGQGSCDCIYNWLFTHLNHIPFYIHLPTPSLMSIVKIFSVSVSLFLFCLFISFL